MVSPARPPRYCSAMNRNLLTAGLTAAVVAALTTAVVGYAAGGNPDDMTAAPIAVLSEPSRVLDERVTGPTDRVTLPDKPWWATAVYVNVVVVDPAAAGYLTMWDCVDMPDISHLNFTARATESNFVAVPLAALPPAQRDAEHRLASDDICIYTSTPADVVVDLIGWGQTASYFRP